MATLGPFAKAWSRVIKGAQQHRKDIPIYKYLNCNLWRGTGKTDNEIKEFISFIGKEIQMFGYTSTSLERNEAEKFMFNNKESGH